LPEVQSVADGRELKLSGFHDRVRALNQVVNVDYYIPGCPPTPELIRDAIIMALEGRLPPKGSVLAEKKALCDTCPRRDSRPERLRILGPATRGGCMARCIHANMPCRGCFGPTDDVRDQGAKSLSFLASMIDSKDEKELERIADSIPDPAGLFYRYSLAASLLKGKIPG
jgi:F420-non-reducing hydrogenase small subunit